MPAGLCQASLEKPIFLDLARVNLSLSQRSFAACVFRAQIVCADQTSFHVRSTCCCCSVVPPSSKYFSAAANQELLANEDLCIRRSVKTNFEKGDS